MQETIQKLLKLIDSSISDFADSLTPIQQQTYSKLLNLAKGLDVYADGTLKNNLNNIKVIGKLKGELEAIVLSDSYVSNVSDFVSAFDEVKNLQDIYFSKVVSDFSDKKLYDEIKKQAVETTVEDLTESGIGVNYTDAIKEILATNITSGGSYADLTKQLSAYVLGDEDTEGGLVKYARQTTTDAINQFSAQYNRLVSDDLGLTWFQYVGSLLTTSRALCKGMVAQRYFHISEVTKILEGHLRDKTVPVNPKTGLPFGMIEGTNPATFFVNRGGYGCGHQIFPVPMADVPQGLKDLFE